MSGITVMLLGASNVGDVQESFLANATNNTSTATYTSPALTLGAETINRYIVVGISGTSGTSGAVPTSVTVAGVTATQLITNTSTTINVGLYIALVPTGATGTVVVTYAASAPRVGVVLWRVTGLLSPTPVQTKVGGAAANTAQSNTISVEADGAVFATSFVNFGTGTTAFRYSAGSYVTATATTLSFSVDSATATTVAWTGIIEDVDAGFTGTSSVANTWYVAASLR